MKLKKIKAFMELARIEHGIMVSIAILTGIITVTGAKIVNYLNLTLSGMIIGLLIEIGVFGFNDYFNVEEDKINAPNRPIVRGDISKKEALVFSASSLAVGIMIPLLLKHPIDSIIILYTVTLLDMLYNAVLKKYGIIGNLAVSISTAMPFIYGAVLITPLTNLPTTTISFFTIALLATLSREIIKDIRDLPGDKKAGIITLPQVVGISNSFKISIILMTTAIILSLLTIPIVKNKQLYTPLIVITDLVLVYSILCVKRIQEVNVRELDKFRKYSLLGMTIGILAFLFGSLA